jgi:hypothetical protein
MRRLRLKNAKLMVLLPAGQAARGRSEKQNIESPLASCINSPERLNPKAQGR